MFWEACSLVLGFALLLKGAEWLVDGSCSIAKRTGVSQHIIGLTLVAFGTSLPEFVVNIASRIEGETDITVGNVLGADIANILLILGLSAVVHPLVFKKSSLLIEIPFALAAAIVLALLLFAQNTEVGAFKGLGRPEGLILLTLLAMFLLTIFRPQRAGTAIELEPPSHYHPPGRAVLMVLAGIPSLAFGARWVVDGAASTANGLGIPEAVVGLTLVALGTTLPELATSLLAAVRRRSDIAIGNIVGSNIFNICGILGISSFISPLAIPDGYLFDVCAIIFATLLLLFSVIFGKRGIIGRWNGIIFLLLYAAYIVSLVFRSSDTVFAR